MKVAIERSISSSAGRLFLEPFPDRMRVELRAAGDALLIADRLELGFPVETKENQVGLGGQWFSRQPAKKPAPCPARWDGLIGEFGWDHDVLYILEKGGRLHALIEWFFEYPVEEDGPDRFRFPDSGLYAKEPVIFTRDDRGRATQVEVGGVVFRRRHLDGEDGKTFRIKPTGDVESLKVSVKKSRSLPPNQATSANRSSSN